MDVTGPLRCPWFMNHMRNPIVTAVRSRYIVVIDDWQMVDEFRLTPQRQPLMTN